VDDFPAFFDTLPGMFEQRVFDLVTVSICSIIAVLEAVCHDAPQRRRNI
jgi:hypothetical protein